MHIYMYIHIYMYTNINVHIHKYINIHVFDALYSAFLKLTNRRGGREGSLVGRGGGGLATPKLRKALGSYWTIGTRVLFVLCV